MSVKKLIKQICPCLYNYLQEKKKELMYLKRRGTNPNDYPKLLEKRYFEITGIKMDINNPTTYSQKIQWLKLYDPNPNRSMLTDKVAVRGWIKEQIGEEYLIPIYGVYNSFDEIDFNESVIMTTTKFDWKRYAKRLNDMVHNSDKVFVSNPSL